MKQVVLIAVNWADNEQFKQAKKVASSLRLVYDIAERNMKLIQEFNASITTDEEQKQNLLQVVSDHREKFPKPIKFLLMGKRPYTSESEVSRRSSKTQREEQCCIINQSTILLFSIMPT